MQFEFAHFQPMLNYNKHTFSWIDKMFVDTQTFD